MRRRSRQFITIVAAAVCAGAAVPQAPSAPSPLVVHEWGTFTSIAGADGQAMTWLPQGGQADLPCFVERSGFNIKAALAGTVRMETPVIYFYAPKPIDASVTVAFPAGVVTEWYPHADVTSTMQALSNGNGAIAWPRVHVQPGAAEAFAVEAGASHYYAARQTGADPVRVAGQAEKFLFYRGVGQFQPPLTAVAGGNGDVAIESRSGFPIGDVILFENRRNAMTFSARHVRGADAAIERPDLDDTSGPPLAELKRTLVANGLFEKEAQAMVDTWKDSWFEEGARLLYIVPRADVDRLLPLRITPQPSAVARVFVGRIELITPATLHDVRAAISSHDRAVLAKYGRFLGAIAERAGLGGKVPPGATPQPASFSCR